MNNVLFGLQEVTTEIEDSLKALGPNSLFTPHHKVAWSNGKVNTQTHYQGLGLISSFELEPVDDSVLGIIFDKHGIRKEDEYSFELAVKTPNKRNPKVEDTVYRYFQIVTVRIDGVSHIVINVHYHYNALVNQKTGEIIQDLIETIKPSVIMGDFNSNPEFDGYVDLLKEHDTFFSPINDTTKLDHVFVKDDVHASWTITPAKKLFELVKLDKANFDMYKTLVSQEERLDIIDEELSKDSYKPYLVIPGESDRILSDHILFTFDVMTANGTKFCMGTLNILAPHSSTAWMLNPLMADRVKDVGRIGELVERIKSACEPKTDLTGGYYQSGNIDFREKYMKYKAKYMSLKNK